MKKRDSKPNGKYEDRGGGRHAPFDAPQVRGKEVTACWPALGGTIFALFATIWAEGVSPGEKNSGQ